MAEIKDRPSHVTDPEAWEEWYNRRKLQIYQRTHKTIYVWKNEIIAPKQLRGAWIEVQYVPYEGQQFQWTMPGKKWNVPVEITKSYTLRVGDALSLLGEDFGYWSPYIIEVDMKGHFILLKCKHIKENEEGDPVSEKMITVNRTIRDGERRTVKIKNPRT